MDKETLATLGADFANALDSGDETSMNSIIDQLAELGMYEEALYFVRAMCRARMISRSETVCA